MEKQCRARRSNGAGQEQFRLYDACTKKAADWLWSQRAASRNRANWEAISTHAEKQLNRASCRAEILKLGHHLKWHLRSLDGLAELLDRFIRGVPEELRRLTNMDDSIGIEAHQLCASRVGGYWIVGEDNSVQRPRRSV